ncbi:YHS domain-containing protein [Chloroflexia bacterium SDU3-3]|nr:YHS domain-containing protein [Chloroflexia bacterium SDU3-3]
MEHQDEQPILVRSQALRELVRRAEAMTRGDFAAQGQPLDGQPALEDLRRAIDVLGTHTEQGLRRQYAYIAALSTAQEAERSRLARELHDDIVQRLIALGHSVERAGRLMERSPDHAAEQLRETRASVTALVDDLRGIIGDLRPPALEELGLLPAAQLLIQRHPAQGVEASVAQQGAARRLAPQSELAVFRIVQEAWANIARHARASRVEIRLRYATDGLHLTIVDDGQGFTPPAPDSAAEGHWGLRGMRERAELTGGTLDVRSQPGQGTALAVFIPYPGEDGRDPVCGMAVGPGDLGATHDGRIFRFCSPACRDLFLAQPDQYLARG